VLSAPALTQLAYCPGPSVRDSLRDRAAARIPPLRTWAPPPSFHLAGVAVMICALISASNLTSLNGVVVLAGRPILGGFAD